jgi:hypothetical protein
MVAKSDSEIRMAGIQLRAKVNALKTLTDTIGKYDHAEDDALLAGPIIDAVRAIDLAAAKFATAGGHD